MAIILMEGFDLVGSNADLLAKGFANTEGTWGAAIGRFGGAGYDVGTSLNGVLSINNSFIRYTTIAFWWRNNQATLDSMPIVGVDDIAVPISGPSATNAHAHITTLADGSVQLLGDNILRATSSPGVIQPQTWHHIEFQADANASGTCNVYVDGLLVVTATADFKDGSAFTSISFFGDGGGTVIDDIVIQTDASTQPPLIGEHKIHTLLPTADTAQADWTGAFTDIDDPFGSADGDSTFISTTTLNNKSEFAVGDLSESPATIHAVQSMIIARKTDAGTKGVTAYIQSGTTRADGTEFAAAETYASDTTIRSVDPDTASAWTVSGVNALLVGVEITT